MKKYAILSGFWSCVAIGNITTYLIGTSLPDVFSVIKLIAIACGGWLAGYNLARYRATKS